MNEKLEDTTKMEVDNIKVPERKLNQTIELAIQTGIRKKKELRKRYIYYTTAALLFFSLLIGSSFVSPTMANMMSKIPYIGGVFEVDEDIVKLISTELIENGYNFDINKSIQDKEITIYIQGSESYFSEVNEEVKILAQNVLQSYGYDNYGLAIKRSLDEKTRKSTEISKESMEFNVIQTELNKELAIQDFMVEQMEMYKFQNKIVLEVPNNEKRIDEIEDIYNKVMNRNELKPIPLEIKRIDLKAQDQENRWSQVIISLSNELEGKKVYNVKTVGFTVHPKVKVNVYLTVSGDTQNTKELARQLEIVIDEYINSNNNIKGKVKNDSYEINIFDVENQKINY